MPVELREVPSPTVSNKDIWSQIAVALQPIIDNLPENDRDYFSGAMNLLIGKEPRISNIPERLIYLMVKKGDNIAFLYTKVYLNGLWSLNDIRYRLTQYLNELAVYLSREGDLMKYGFGGWTQQFQTQKIVTEEHPAERKRKKILGLF
jgi:hypothetical protein